MQNKKNISRAYIALGVLMIIAAIVLAVRQQGTSGGPSGASAYDRALAACNAYPNGSTQHATDTSRLMIYLPKELYPVAPLNFMTVSGTATAGWISNAGPMGEAAGATDKCAAYYYEFNGTGEVDLNATSSVKSVPGYTVHFMVNGAQ